MGDELVGGRRGLLSGVMTVELVVGREIGDVVSGLCTTTVVTS